MKSSPAISPGRDTLTTLPEESQATPSQVVQQFEVDVHDFKRFEGSEVILCLKSSSAALSMAWQASDLGVEKKAVRKRMKRKDKVLLQMVIFIESMDCEQVELRA